MQWPRCAAGQPRAAAACLLYAAARPLIAAAALLSTAAVPHFSAWKACAAVCAKQVTVLVLLYAAYGPTYTAVDLLVSADEVHGGMLRLN